MPEFPSRFTLPIFLLKSVLETSFLADSTSILALY
nr:MAG TPA: hypothetical protein [Caudoviricetes sp.]